MNIKRFFRIAKNASKESDWPTVHVGAVIIQKNKILSVGCNSKKEHPLQKEFNFNRNFDPNRFPNCVHAEINAINKALKNNSEVDFSRCSIFIYREHKNGDLALAKPCPACEAALRFYKFNRVFYTGEQSLIQEKYSYDEKE